MIRAHVMLKISISGRYRTMKYRLCDSTVQNSLVVSMAEKLSRPTKLPAMNGRKETGLRLIGVMPVQSVRLRNNDIIIGRREKSSPPASEGSRKGSALLIPLLPFTAILNLFISCPVRIRTGRE